MRTYLPDQKNIKWELTFANALCGRNQKLVEEKVYGNIIKYQIQNRRESEKEENELLVGLCFHEDEKLKKQKKIKINVAMINSIN